MDKLEREIKLVEELNRILMLDKKYRENTEFVALTAIQLLNNKLIMTENGIKSPNDRD